jgi:fructosamine-3-kinase
MHANTLATELEKANLSAKVRTVRALEGGSHAAYWVETDDFEAFVKLPQAADVPDMLQAECDGLQALAAAPFGYRVPKVLGVTDKALILEYIAPGKRNNETDFDAGVQLAKFHAANTATAAGWHRDNWIGALRQTNGTVSGTVEHYLSHRIAPMAELAQPLLGAERTRQVRNVAERYAVLVKPEQPVLLHGDFWSGNFWMDANGQPVWADPAVYYGHREIDLAMSQLFGGFRDAFYEGYASIHRFDEAWENRTHFWQLYPLLVHVNLFGSGYLGELDYRIAQLLRALNA